MAYSANAFGVFQGRPDHRLNLYVYVAEQDRAGNRSRLAWGLYAERTGAWQGSFNNSSFGYSVNVGGNITNGAASLPFSASTSQLLLRTGDHWFNHDGNGYLSVFFSAVMPDAAQFGTAQTNQGRLDADRIAPPTFPPGAPDNGIVDNATINSLRYRFSGTTDGGSAILEWQAQADDDANFGSPITVSSSGTSTFTGLTPATRYFFRARGRNGVGWGPWGASASGETLTSSPPSLRVSPSLSGAQATITLSPPSGVSSVSSYKIQRRRLGETAVTDLAASSSPYTATRLSPGVTYQWRAAAVIGSYQTNWSAWVTAAQPNPNTSAGEYFDGSSPIRQDVAYRWDGAANNSASRGVAYAPLGWRSFASGRGTSGGNGTVMRSSGGMDGGYCARVLFFADTTAAGFIAGIAFEGASEIVPGAPYFGSLHVNMSETRTRYMQAGICWYSSIGLVLGYSWSPELVLPQATEWVRLSASGVAPEGATRGAPVVRDAIPPEQMGYGHGAYGHGEYGHGGATAAAYTPFEGGDALLLDRAALTLSSLFPYFDGSTPDTIQYAYDWLGDPHNSVSTRETLSFDGSDLLLDPDCPAPPTAPKPPTIENECIVEVGTWRRYWVIIPSDQISEWLEVIPTITVNTGGFAARQVRIRFYANPGDLEPGAVSPDSWESEQIISYMPANTALTLDGVAQRVWASVDGSPDIPASRLLYGTGGGPATWPTLSCGTAYVVSFDVPVDAPDGNISVDVALTTRMM